MWASKVFPIGIGTDICQISRIYKNLSSDSGVKFLQRILTHEELKTPRAVNVLKCVYISQKREKTSEPDRAIMRAAEYVAGRFAAKEAVMKAHSPRKIYFRDIEIGYEHQLAQEAGGEESSENSLDAEHEPLMPDSSHDSPRDDPLRKSAPVALIRGRGAREDAYARVSISHDGDYAVAFCLAYHRDLGSLES
ncbi:hypothetical protein F5Y05DRAFT_389625 [Hypoxylon sp. FL0543]|nr:hypothetical protein F5Y05DRAFT_389625 [Hypoxylon sp. FL0543]